VARVRLTAGEAPADDPRWREVLLAIDVGTSGARAAAFDLDGRRRLEARVPYPTTVLHEGWAEQDPRRWRSAALASLGGIVRGLGRRRRILAIGLTGQCPSICLVDERGEPVRPGLIYRDNRATRDAAMLRERFGEAAIHARTGHLPAAFHVLPKLLWVRDHEPAAWARARWALQPRDLVGLALTGEAATDGTHAAATIAYDLRAGDWDRAAIISLALADDLFPPVRPSWETVGMLRPRLAARLGLTSDVPVVLGGADSQACALGSGVVAPGPVSEMAGSSTCLNAVVPEPLPELLVTHYPHVVPGGFTTETGINTTGAAVGWLADLAYGGRLGRANTADYERLDREVASVPPGADGVLALPAYADGERTDPDLRAAFAGLSLRHGRAVMALAILEGVAYLIRDQLGLLTACGAPVDELRVSGGDTRIATWNRVKADVIGIPVRTVPGDAAVTGVAMLAGLGAGVYASVEEAVARCVRLDPPIEPNAANRAIYDEGYQAFRDLMTATVVRRPDREG
jgi:sugar (pentulose or hexulose) kinase